MDMPLKPQVLSDLVSDVNLSAAVPQQAWRDTQRDVIQLEDESGRICLVGHKLSDELLCTGIVVAVLGSETSSEEFNVIDIIYPESIEASIIPASNGSDQFAPKVDRVAEDQSNADDEGNAKDSYVALISGLELSGNTSSSVSIDLLEELLTGELFDGPEQEKIAKICSLIIVGNSLQSQAIVDDDAMARRLNKNKKYGYDSALFNPRPISALDDFLSEICKSIDVIVMPGDQDPTNSTLPQQPVNRLMLRKASHYSSSSLTLTTNPAYLQFAGRTMFCTSGQTINDIAHYISNDVQNAEEPGNEVEGSNPLNLAESTLRWSHAAPTAPDTLWTYPFSDRDPFIFDQPPNIYVIGNQEAFDYRFFAVNHSSDSADSGSSNCVIVSLPRFSVTRQLVLLNLRSLQCEVISFPVDT